jgi:hypothetical protein
VAGPAGANVIHGLPPVEAGDVDDIHFSIAPDNRHVIYIADQETDSVNELYVSYEKPTAAWRWADYE